ncbi:hypothetical protein Ancab_005847 [Ancistrocladus abbreviatus]
MMSGQMGGKRKRPRPESDSSRKDLNGENRVVLQLIRNKGDMGICKGDLKKEPSLRNIKAKAVDASIGSLINKNMIKEVVDSNDRGRIHLIAAELEPSVKLTGGVRNDNGTLIESLKLLCLTQIHKMKVATAKAIHDFVENKTDGKVSSDRVDQTLGCLVLDKEILQTESTGSGEFSGIPIGTVCYKRAGRGQVHMAAIPCGACPRINYCTPDGVISPSTCMYYDKWLDF